MRALVVYESMFGNTEEVARAIGEGIAASMHADVVEVGAAPDTVPADVILLVVGGPTHAFSMCPGQRHGEMPLSRPGPPSPAIVVSVNGSAVCLVRPLRPRPRLSTRG